MSFLGKLLIVCILVMSLLFMTFGLVVNQTHRDLDAEAKLLKEQAREAKTTYDGLVTRHKQLDQQLLVEDREALMQLRKLEFELVELGRRNELLTEEYEGVKAERRQMTSDVSNLQQQNVALGEQVEETNTEITGHRTARNAALSKSIEATEQLHQLHGQLENVLERNRGLSKQVGGNG